MKRNIFCGFAAVVIMAVSVTALVPKAGFAYAPAAAFAAEDDPVLLTQQARDTARQGNLSAALKLANRAIKLAPKQSQNWLIRAQIYDQQRNYAKAVTDYSEVLRLNPKLSPAWQARGEAQFKQGKIAESLKDFDTFLSLEPDQKPFHWQRGIALYYAGRFAEGKQQFEIHQTVNSHDVENAVWHFLCTTRAEGLEAAKKQLIPIDQDVRIPMAQVHQLFAGKASPEAVLAAAQAAPLKTPAGEPLFYAHLYLGLYFEAIGDEKQSAKHISQAAMQAKANGYMGDVARVHATRMKRQKSKPAPPNVKPQGIPNS